MASQSYKLIIEIYRVYDLDPRFVINKDRIQNLGPPVFKQWNSQLKYYRDTKTDFNYTLPDIEDIDGD